MNNTKIILLIICFLVFMILSIVPTLTSKVVMKSRKDWREKTSQHQVHGEDLARFQNSIIGSMK